jgi:hypothetical protein
VVIDRGEFYPHHNLYWITSDEWGLEELQAVLRSTLARFFVATYCVKMANGFLRFQAQYLRRIRIPAWSTVSPVHRQALRAAVAQLDQAAIDAAVYAVVRARDGRHRPAQSLSRGNTVPKNTMPLMLDNLDARIRQAVRDPSGRLRMQGSSVNRVGLRGGEAVEPVSRSATRRPTLGAEVRVLDCWEEESRGRLGVHARPGIFREGARAGRALASEGREA